MKQTKHDDLDGWLIVDKPTGIGSTDVVNLTRRLFNAAKNGHTGTLDPFASGVLPIAFGQTTKLIPFVTDGNKEYEFTLTFGKATSTDDTEGEVTAISDVIPAKEDISAVLGQFVGEIQQVPPIYSAIKINGQRAYKLARQGQNITMPPRKVQIFKLELIKQLSPDSFSFRVECSKGTYVRALGRDIALKLGTVGYLKELRRTKCGIFSLDDTILLEKLKNMVYEDNRCQFLLPTETSLRDIAVIAVSSEDAAKLRFGQSISPRSYNLNGIQGSAAALLDGRLVSLVRVEEKRISPIRVFK